MGGRPAARGRKRGAGSRRKSNAVRIIGGAWRRRLIQFAGLPDLRPTPDRVRETLFNWLGQDLSGLHCLDLFAGSGALGFEAASRGAAQVVLVESNRDACAALLENARRLGSNRVRVERADALEFVARERSRFDVIFLDPPFRHGLPSGLLDRLAERLAPGGRLYLESDRPFSGAPGWRAVKSRRAGKVHYTLLERSSDDQGGLSRDF